METALQNQADLHDLKALIAHTEARVQAARRAAQEEEER